jgi:16S rRNA (guanine527-N7)-methyltransferase
VTDTDLDGVLERSRSLGFLGPGSVRVHVEHAAGFAAGVPVAPGSVLDLGSGGGVPGLVLARRWPGCELVLLDAGERRCDFLRSAVRDLGLDDRVRVVRGRAEEAGRDPALRGRFDVVVARGFGPPPVTAECGAPFLRVGGRLIVSDPPRDGDGEPGGGDGSGAGADDVRWPPAGVAPLGLVVGRAWRRPFHYQELRQQHPCPDRYPRRNGVPAKRPLF